MCYISGMSETDTQAAPAQDPAQDTSDGQGAQSEASEQKQEAPEATQGQETEVKAEDTAEEKLFAGKYKTVEDLEKSYKELESKHGQTATEKAELARILNEAFVAPEAAQQQEDTDYSDTSEVSKPAADDSVKRDLSVMKFTMAHPDADGQSILEVLSKDPLIKSITGYDAKLEYAYAKSKAMSGEKAVAEAKKSGAQEAQAKAAEKEVAQVESAKKAEPIDEQAELYKQATSGNPDERKAARLSLIKKNLVHL